MYTICLRPWRAHRMIDRATWPQSLSGTSVWRPQSRYTVSRIECRSEFPQNQRYRAKIVLHPPKSRCRTFLRTPLSHFPLIRSRQGAKGGVSRRAGGGHRGTLGFRKQIALQRGVAATVTPVALLCASKPQILPHSAESIGPPCPQRAPTCPSTELPLHTTFRSESISVVKVRESTLRTRQVHRNSPKTHDYYSFSDWTHTHARKNDSQKWFAHYLCTRLGSLVLLLEISSRTPIFENNSDHPYPHISKKYVPEICHKMRGRMA